MIIKGQIVNFKLEWQDEGDASVTFRALENEDGGRVLIIAEIGLTFNPTQVVHTFMLKY